MDSTSPLEIFSIKGSTQEASRLLLVVVVLVLVCLLLLLLLVVVVVVLPGIGVLLPLPSLIPLYSFNLFPGYEVALKPGGAHLRRVADLGLKFDFCFDIHPPIHTLYTELDIMYM